MGISIILLTVVLRLLLYPLNSWSMKATIKAQRTGPKVKALQEKYKNDPNRMRMEVMNLYKSEGGNPLGGCFPLLIQLPFLLGMLDLLKSSFQLRGASFIPGWIDDLGYPDVLFSWSYPIPFIGTSFHLLPILLGLIMYFQQKIVSTGSMQTPTTDQQRQQRFMGNMMTIVFTVMFYNFPSGLNIYWISNMLLGILQQWWTNKKMGTSKK
jgi:YidC/Oxa1 family membrane protein insertase